jgi:hypothetical protein
MKHDLRPIRVGIGVRLDAAVFRKIAVANGGTPNGLIYLAYVGAVLLAVGVLVLGIGLVRRPARRS